MGFGILKFSKCQTDTSASELSWILLFDRMVKEVLRCSRHDVAVAMSHSESILDVLSWW